MNLIVGLGNPGPQYSRSRHNAGFYVLDELAVSLGGTFQKKGAVYDYFEKTDEGVKTLFVKPLTYMNLSGNIFNELRNVRIDRMVVVCDNIDLALGKIRFRNGGSSAGHNGLKNMMEKYPGHADFYRMYIGVGRDEGSDVPDMVLRKLPQETFDEIKSEAARAAGVIAGFLKDWDFAKAQAACS